MRQIKKNEREVHTSATESLEGERENVGTWTSTLSQMPVRKIKEDVEKEDLCLFY